MKNNHTTPIRALEDFCDREVTGRLPMPGNVFKRFYFLRPMADCRAPPMKVYPYPALHNHRVADPGFPEETERRIEKWKR
jgi:hypothetical protein